MFQADLGPSTLVMAEYKSSILLKAEYDYEYILTSMSKSTSTFFMTFSKHTVTFYEHTDMA